MIQPVRTVKTESEENVAKIKKSIVVLNLLLLTASVRAAVHVFVEDVNGVAWIKYECTAGEVVRAFALDVTVDRGQIVGISDFFRGESRTWARGYGIFPAAFRDHVTVNSGTNANWDVSGYTPLAVVADSPGDTLLGLGSSGVTVEFGALWDPGVPSASPDPAGTLCALEISAAANVSVAANLSRGGVVSASPNIHITPVFTDALVGPAIISATLVNGAMTVNFKGGELETATSVNGVWTGTGNTNGTYTESVGGLNAKFYRVHRH